MIMTADRATVYDVAARAGVSTATVSFAFRRPEKVRPETRERVLAAAHELAYVPSASARGLAHGRTRALGMLVHGVLLQRPEGVLAAATGTDPILDRARVFPLYVDEVGHGVELCCHRHGYSLLVNGVAAGSSGADAFADLAGRVDALVVFRDTVPRPVLRTMAERMPIVELAAASRDPRLCHVTVDDTGGARAMTEHLLAEHRLRRLEFVGDVAVWDQRRRFAGFAAALRARDLPVPAALSHGGHARHHAARIAENLAQRLAGTRRRAPQGVVCATDEVALALIDALSHLGIDVPGDIAVTGFDGILASRVFRPALTTVRQPMERLGSLAIDLLIERLDHPRLARAAVQLPVTPVIGNSCGC
ncbi:LacI family DNA-binding transcriptional regulator [Microlunatus ginsengisoli]